MILMLMVMLDMATVTAMDMVMEPILHNKI